MPPSTRANTETALGTSISKINKLDPSSNPRPPVSVEELINFGKYERKVNKAQLLQKVATTIAIKGPFLITSKNGIYGAAELVGASAFIYSSSSLEMLL